MSYLDDYIEELLQERDYQIAEKILNDIVTNFIQNKNNTISNTQVLTR